MPVGTPNRHTRETREHFHTILVLILLIIIWIISNFTIFVCATALVLGVKIITQNSETRENTIAISSQQPSAHAPEDDSSERISVDVKG